MKVFGTKNGVVDSTGSEPFLAFAVLLSLLIATSFAIQFVGDVFYVSLVRYALPIAFLPCIWATYGYFFSFSYRNILIGLILAAVLTAIGVASGIYWLDFSYDALDYQQPSVDSILHGWDPLHTDVVLMWQQVQPFGAWSVEASLALLYGSIEAARMLNVWWIWIAVAVLCAGLRTVFGKLQCYHYVLVWLCVLHPLVIAQFFTHYVDAMVYLEGLVFIGAMMMQGKSPRRNQLSRLLMAVSLLSMINTKISGLYWGVMLCAGAILYLYCKQKRIPWKMTGFLFVCGVIFTLGFGYHPYVKNLEDNGSFLPCPLIEIAEGAMARNLYTQSYIVRSIYSIFSIEDATYRQDAVLKWPWMIYPVEWRTGDQSVSNCGWGPLFALGLLLSTALFFYVFVKRKGIPHKEIVYLAPFFLGFCICFGEGWLARYTPFTYVVPFLLLLASCLPDTRPPLGVYLVLCVFAANSIIPARATYRNYLYLENNYYKTVDTLHKLSPHLVYLVPHVGERFETVDRAYVAIQRRLHEQGINALIKIDMPCPNKLATWVDFAVCYN